MYSMYILATSTVHVHLLHHVTSKHAFVVSSTYILQFHACTQIKRHELDRNSLHKECGTLLSLSIVHS